MHIPIGLQDEPFCLRRVDLHGRRPRIQRTESKVALGCSRPQVQLGAWLTMLVDSSHINSLISEGIYLQRWDAGCEFQQKRMHTGLGT
jgi:hypothetical protein